MVAAGGGLGEGHAARPARCQGDVLQKSRAQGDGVGVVADPIQTQANIFGAGEIEGPGPRQAEHGLVGDIAIGLPRLQGGVGDVVGGEDLAALDQRGDLILVEDRGFDQGTSPVPFWILGSRPIFWP